MHRPRGAGQISLISFDMLRASSASMARVSTALVAEASRGIGLIHTLDDLTEADFDQTIAVNLKSALFLCTEVVLPGMHFA